MVRWPVSLPYVRAAITAATLYAARYLVPLGLLWFVALPLVAVLGLLWSLGVFDELVFVDTTVPAMDFFYQRHVGPFSRISSAMHRLFAQFSQRGPLSFGVYFDNPREVTPDKLRWWVGAMGTPLPEARLEHFTNHHPLKVDRKSVV